MPSPAAQSSLPPTGPGGDAPTGDARVIPFRSERVPEQSAGNEADRVTNPQERLERYIESRFLGEGLTLNDADTARAFRITLDAVQHIHDAALNQGVIDQSQHGTLSAWLHGLRLVPDGLSPRP